MKIVVSTLCTSDCLELREVTQPIKEEYCNINGYTFREASLDFADDRPELGWHHATFERWRKMSELLEECDAMLFCGADVLITNLGFRLEWLARSSPVVIAKDAAGYQSDVVFARSTPESIRMLKMVWEVREKFLSGHMLDQAAFAHVAGLFPGVVQTVPQRVMNSYDYRTLGAWRSTSENYHAGCDADGNDGQWQPGDFILHTPGIPMSQKIEVLRSHLPKIRR